MKLKDKVVLITGASSGIGKATAIEAAKQGAIVVIASRRKKENQETITKIKEAGGIGYYRITDLSIESDIKELISDIMERYGRLDCAYNNAGTIGAWKPLIEQTGTDFQQTFDINSKAVFLCIKYEALAMIGNGGGSIVNCSSWLSRGALMGSSVYSSSKASVDGLMRAAALELSSKSIRVNNIAPGGIATEMTVEALGKEGTENFGKTHPIGRIGEPHEVAKLVTWLLSEEASFITGESILIDGGYTIPGQRN